MPQVLISDKPKRKARIINEQSFKDSLIRVNNTMHKALFCILYGTGARIGEIVRTLRKGDIEFEADGYLKINFITEKHRKNPLREVYISPERHFLIEPILRWKEMCMEETLFTLSRQRAWKLTDKYFGTKPHSFRHTDATRSGQRGLNPWEMQQRYGWADFSSSESYIMATAQDSKKKI